MVQILCIFFMKLSIGTCILGVTGVAILPPRGFQRARWSALSPTCRLQGGSTAVSHCILTPGDVACHKIGRETPQGRSATNSIEGDNGYRTRSPTTRRWKSPPFGNCRLGGRTGTT
ncbi:hypothetical protein THTE_2157 [Thermogutta terrifontis]|uniref:Uncharacterized protein n=1 Tax=Thermogutta terrifontis TaxID=1331910 RepID=A0A286RFL8_9BACT|nr:hypothetical protein THTE_2157 [Thermogutta terrifontis]